MNDDAFAYLSSVLKNHSGLHITREKLYLLESRLLPVMKAHGAPSLNALADRLKRHGDARIVTDIAEAMTTSESLFFRDGRPFEQLRRALLPRMLAGGNRSIRLWSAACAGGQEAYSLAMSMLEEEEQFKGCGWSILASDFSERALAKARTGIYTSFEVERGLPPEMRRKYFIPLEGGAWQASQALRDPVTFSRINLLENTSHLGRFDVIFCRNLLIYLDQSHKKRLLDKLSAHLGEGGALVLGSVETPLGLCNTYKTLENEHGVYIVAG